MLWDEYGKTQKSNKTIIDEGQLKKMMEGVCVVRFHEAAFFRLCRDSIIIFLLYPFRISLFIYSEIVILYSQDRRHR